MVIATTVRAGGKRRRVPELDRGVVVWARRRLLLQIHRSQAQLSLSSRRREDTSENLSRFRFARAWFCALCDVRFCAVPASRVSCYTVPPAAQRRLMVTPIDSFERLERTFACSPKVGESDLRAAFYTTFCVRHDGTIPPAPPTCPSRFITYPSISKDLAPSPPSVT